ncbi:hypothetical protein FQA39_LY13213 [Lamprigera yunnana]|nr:hypothetical protein FQA39_LY13213 [Lamprigera yunnana]
MRKYPDSDSEDNLELSHRIRRVNQSSDRFTDSLGIEIGKTANENQDGVKNVNFSDDSYADPDYAPSGQSLDSEVEQALIKSTKSGPDNSVSENVHGTTSKAPKKEKRKQIRDTGQWKATKRTMETLSGRKHISKTDSSHNLEKSYDFRTTYNFVVPWRELRKRFSTVDDIINICMSTSRLPGIELTKIATQLKQGLTAPGSRLVLLCGFSPKLKTS